MVDVERSEQANRVAPVQENMAVQRRLWLIERVGFWLMLLVVALTLAGVFSKGFLSDVRTNSADHLLRAEYQRYLRNGATSVLVVELHGAANSLLTLSTQGELLEGLTVESITPQPEQSSSYIHQGLQLKIRADAQGIARVHIAFRADGVGAYTSSLESGSSRLQIHQFIYP